MAAKKSVNWVADRDGVLPILQGRIPVIPVPAMRGKPGASWYDSPCSIFATRRIMTTEMHSDETRPPIYIVIASTTKMDGHGRHDTWNGLSIIDLP